MAEKSIDDAAAYIPDLYNEVLKRMSDILIEGEKNAEIDDDLLITLDGLLLRLKLWGMDVGDADGMAKLTEHNDLAASTRDSLETILMTIDLAKSLGIWQQSRLAGDSSTAKSETTTKKITEDLSRDVRELCKTTKNIRTALGIGGSAIHLYTTDKELQEEDLRLENRQEELNDMIPDPEYYLPGATEPQMTVQAVIPPMQSGIGQAGISNSNELINLVSRGRPFATYAPIMDPIPINLVPDGGLGTVHGANLGQIQTYTGFKSEVHYNLYITTEIHGYGIFDGKRLPATVLVYDLISTGGPEKRIKNLTLQITFKPIAPAEHPRIIHIQPEIPVDMTTTDEEQVLTRTDEIEGGGQVGYGPAKGYLKGKHTDQTQITKKKYFAATVHGSRRPSERRLRYPDTVHWVARENQSQSDGIMPECYFAALIIRPTGGDFVAHYKVTAEVDWAYSVKQAMSEFKDWISKDSPRQTFTPATNPSTDKPPEDLHKYTDVEELKKFVEIKTRYEYNQYKHGSDPTSAQQTQGTGQPAGPATNPQQAAAGGAAGGASGGDGGGGDDEAAGAGNVDTEDPGQEEGAVEDAVQEDANISVPGNDSIDPGAA